MADKVWKVLERAVSKFWGADRNPLSGSNSHHTASDSRHKVLYIECKYSKSLPKYIMNLWEDTVKKAKDEGKIPLCALKQKNMKGFLVLTSSEYIDQIINEREIIF